jgi:hypothetical protein
VFLAEYDQFIALPFKTFRADAWAVPSLSNLRIAAEFRLASFVGNRADDTTSVFKKIERL